MLLCGSAQVHSHELDGAVVAQSGTFVALCSKGDLRATYSNRSDAVKAAEAHAKATGHKTSVKKQ